MAIDLSTYATSFVPAGYRVRLPALGGEIGFVLRDSEWIDFSTTQPIVVWGLFLRFSGSFYVHRGLLTPGGVTIGKLKSEDDAISDCDRGEHFLQRLEKVVHEAMVRIVLKVAVKENGALRKAVLQQSLAEVADKISYIDYLRAKNEPEWNDGYLSTMRSIASIDEQLMATSVNSIHAYVLVKDGKLVRKAAPSYRSNAGWFAQCVYLHYESAFAQRRRFKDETIDIVRVIISDGEVRPVKGFGGSLKGALPTKGRRVIVLSDPVTVE